MSDRRKILSIRPPQGNIDVYESGNAVTTYVEGVNSVGLNATTCKIEFFEAAVPLSPTGGATVSQGINGPPEERIVTLRLVMPTKALVDFCVTTLKTISENRAALTSAFEANLNELKSSLDAASSPK